jgi:hypothetical protein
MPAIVWLLCLAVALLLRPFLAILAGRRERMVRPHRLRIIIDAVHEIRLGKYDIGRRHAQLIGYTRMRQVPWRRRASGNLGYVPARIRADTERACGIRR